VGHGIDPPETIVRKPNLSHFDSFADCVHKDLGPWKKPELGKCVTCKRASYVRPRVEKSHPLRIKNFLHFAQPTLA
jgi:hypothetical protein